MKDMAGKGKSWLGIAAALGTLYLVWGTTYLGIRYAIEGIPPFLMAGVRFLVAGTIMYVWARLSGLPRPSRQDWKTGALMGLFIILGGNGTISMAELYVPSGLTALMIGTVPVWMVLLDWLAFKGKRPSLKVAAGLVLGLAGIILLAGPGRLAATQRGSWIGLALLLTATLSWSYGTLTARSARLFDFPLMATALEMLTGGVFDVATGTALGQWNDFHPELVSLRSLAALAYLILVGSVVGFTCYVWLIKKVSPAVISSYAYVNPVVAIFAGWMVAGEQLNARILSATGIIIAGVALVTLGSGQVSGEEHG
jgi:drug/metabolite transporter (DMT)-like permease